MTDPDRPPLHLGDQHGRSPANVWHPSTVYRVRWTRENWQPQNGGTRWKGKHFASWRAAQRSALRLMADGAQVELTTYKVVETSTMRYRPKPPPPPPRRRPDRLRLVSTEGDQ